MSKLDANSGYWQMALDEPSPLKCKFITPFRRFAAQQEPRLDSRQCQKSLIAEWMT